MRHGANGVLETERQHSMVLVQAAADICMCCCRVNWTLSLQRRHNGKSATMRFVIRCHTHTFCLINTCLSVCQSVGLSGSSSLTLLFVIRILTECLSLCTVLCGCCSGVVAMRCPSQVRQSLGVQLSIAWHSLGIHLAFTWRSLDSCFAGFEL